MTQIGPRFQYSGSWSRSRYTQKLQSRLSISAGDRSLTNTGSLRCRVKRNGKNTAPCGASDHLIWHTIMKVFLVQKYLCLVSIKLKSQRKIWWQFFLWQFFNYRFFSVFHKYKATVTLFQFIKYDDSHLKKLLQNK